MTPTTDAAEIARIAGGLTKAQRWVPDYENRYYIDDRGEIYSVARTFERLNRGRSQTVRVPGGRLKQCLNRNGYPFVRLYTDNKGRTFEVHRLACRAFHGEPEDGQEAAHIDGDRTNPSALNLTWKTRSGNMQDKRRHGTLLTGDAVPNSKLSKSRAVEICRRALSGEGGRALAREFGVNEATVRKIKIGLMWADHTLAVRNHLEANP